MARRKKRVKANRCCIGLGRGLDLLQLFNTFRVLLKADRDQRGKLVFLFRLYRKLDQDISRFRKKTGLRCEQGCGRCCEYPQVETTVFELIPLAINLWQHNQALAILEKAKKAQYQGQCIFYQADPLIKGKGRCSIYSWRPLGCRLFGFSARSDKNKKLELVT